MKGILILTMLIPWLAFSQSANDAVIGYWSLNGNANDETAYCNNGTVFSANQATDRCGRENSAFDFNIGQYISIGDPSEFDFQNNEFSISLWFFRTDTTSIWNGVIAGKWNTAASPGTNEWALFASQTGEDDRFAFWVEIGNTRYETYDPNILELNKWYNVIAVRKNTSIALHVDGNLVSSNTIPDASINNVGRVLELGRINNNGDTKWLNGGKIDDLILFNKALSESEIYEIANDNWQFNTLCPNIYCIGENVGIGTSDTKGYKLAVAGKTITEEVKVELISNWPDFVFENGYNLLDLEEVENFITVNKHLPEIPSESEVKEDGINLGEMNAKLLQKIEELTLYLIEQHKEIKELKEKVQRLDKKLLSSD